MHREPDRPRPLNHEELKKVKRLLDKLDNDEELDEGEQEFFDSYMERWSH